MFIVNQPHLTGKCGDKCAVISVFVKEISLLKGFFICDDEIFQHNSAGFFKDFVHPVFNLRD